MHPYALDRYAEDRAEQLRQMAAVRRVSSAESLLPSVRHAAGRALIGLGERLLADVRHPARHLSAL